MVRYFHDENIEKLRMGLADIQGAYRRGLCDFVSLNYNSERGREFGVNGYARRLGVMSRSIESVFLKLPPELDEIPDRNDVIDATIAIQSFVLNAWGSLDNLAWILVCERNIVADNGAPLSPKQVGLGREFKAVRRALSPGFNSTLDKYEQWANGHLKKFRDSLAHRIPLYIPPFMVRPEDASLFSNLENEKNNHIMKGDIDAYEKAEARQREIMFWRPWMTHSFSEAAPSVVFHAQLIADYRTIDEIGGAILRELDSGCH